MSSNTSTGRTTKNTKACICIPARLNSSRLPGKLMYKLGDKTCIQRTIDKCLQTKMDVYVLTNNLIVHEHVSTLFPNVKCILSTEECKNGTERISKHLNYIDEKYGIIVNVQADEPFIDPANIIKALIMHCNVKFNKKHFYTTLHQEISSIEKEYLNSTSCLTLETTMTNRVLTYTRNVIPFNKQGTIVDDYMYKTFTGIYVFNRELLKIYHTLNDTPLQQMEDIEQLKILEHDYDIYSYNTATFNEISLNDAFDLKYLCEKYQLECTPYLSDLDVTASTNWSLASKEKKYIM